MENIRVAHPVSEIPLPAMISAPPLKKIVEIIL